MLPSPLVRKRAIEAFKRNPEMVERASRRHPKTTKEPSMRMFLQTVTPGIASVGFAFTCIYGMFIGSPEQAVSMLLATFVSASFVGVGYHQAFLRDNSENIMQSVAKDMRGEVLAYKKTRTRNYFTPEEVQSYKKLWVYNLALVDGRLARVYIYVTYQDKIKWEYDVFSHDLDNHRLESWDLSFSKLQEQTF